MIKPDPYFKERFNGVRIFRIPSDPDQIYHEILEDRAFPVPFRDGRCWALRDAAGGLFYTQSPLTILKIIKEPSQGGILKYLLAGMTLSEARSKPWPSREDKIRSRPRAQVDLSSLDLDL